MPTNRVRSESKEMSSEFTNIISDDNFAHQRLLPSLDLSNRCSNLSTLMSQLDFAQGSSSGPFPDRLLVSIFLGGGLSRPPDLF
jgi:hypothetical protein